MTTVSVVADCCVRLIALQRSAADVISVSVVEVVLVVILVLSAHVPDFHTRLLLPTLAAHAACIKQRQHLPT